jgi:sulfide:quinone oxidoreductase
VKSLSALGWLQPDYAVAPQLLPEQMAAAAAAGFRTIVCNRPDAEEADQPSAAVLAAAARDHGLGFVYLPVAGQPDQAAVDAVRGLEGQGAGPVLGFCRTGRRAAMVWALSRSGRLSPDAILGAARAAGHDLTALRDQLEPFSTPGPRTFDIVVVGGGSAGIAAGASILRRAPWLSLAIIEPSDTHYYQPGWTLVGADVLSSEQTCRPMERVMPRGAHWIRAAAAGFAPEQNLVLLGDGSAVGYRVLVVAPGLRLDWEAVAGLAATLGSNGVTSNYRFDLAPYTWQLVRSLRGGKALFTQPPLPIKCPGAPQKAAYLSCDHWRTAGRLPSIDVEFHLAGAALFGVAAYVPALMRYIERYGIGLHFGSRLVAVDGPGRVARFEIAAADGTVTSIERRFDMLHAVPPQSAPECVRNSALAAPSGFVEVDETTLVHPRFANVFGLGDGCATSNSKTAAAARKQAPVVAVNALAALEGLPPRAGYDGYGSCPLTVERGRVVLAEFTYGGKLAPSFPSWLLEGTEPTRAGWIVKADLLPPIYWHLMLKGREWLARPHPLR